MRFVNKQRKIPDAISSIIDPILATEGNDGYNSLGSLRKAEILSILIGEQDSLCAYCNQRITVSSSTIEHFVCQSHNPSLDLNYFNLFAVCKGNQGVIRESYCDKFRANGANNDYFFPFIFFNQCATYSWNNTNPFFDVEYNRRTDVLSGKIKAKEANINGYPNIQSRIKFAIDVLNLNASELIKARQVRWQAVLDTKNKMNLSWEGLFEHYLNSPIIDFHEFVLLAIRRQVT